MAQTDSNFSTALAQWRAKHRIGEDDPIFPTLELLELYLRERSASESPSFDDLRQWLEAWGRDSKTLSRQLSTLSQELRQLPKVQTELNRFPFFALIFSALISLGAGILIGKFIL